MWGESSGDLPVPPTRSPCRHTSTVLAMAPKAALPALNLASVSLSPGIVGLPNVGKVDTFQRADPKQRGRGQSPVRDDRIERRYVSCPSPPGTPYFRSQRVVPAPVTFVDTAGLVKASEGAGLGNKFLAHIRECDAICQVARYLSTTTTHVTGRVDSVRH